MKISVVCTGKGSTVKSISGGDVIVYHVDFAVAREENPNNQEVYGMIHFESPTPFDYVEKSEYTIVLSDAISLVDPADLNKVANIH